MELISKKVTILAALTAFVAVACTKDPTMEKRKQLANQQSKIQKQIESLPQPTSPDEDLTLAPINSNGLSHNSFSVDLKPNTHPKTVWLSYQFDAGSYKKMHVSLPTVVAEGCQEKPEILKLSPEGSPKGTPAVELFYYKIGWPGEPQQEEVESIYGKDLDLSSQNRHQTIELEIFAAKTCTKLSGSFDVEFKP